MANMIYDRRKWFIKGIPNESCPYLFFPDGRHGCRLLERADKDCTQENCPRFMISGEDPAERKAGQ